MSSDYGYINARIRAMKSFLLREEDYLGAMRQRTLGEYTSFLSSMPAYAGDLKKVMHCDEGLNLNSSRIFKKIIDFCDDKPKKLIQRLLAYLKILEKKLYETYFKEVFESISSTDSDEKIVSDYLSIQVDFVNIRLVLLNSKPLNIRGKLTEEFLKDLINLRTPEDILSRFGDSVYPWLAEEGLDLYKSTKKLSSMERLFRNRLFSYCFSLYTSGDPLSIGIPLAFINFKENEIYNLRLIGEAISFGMPMNLVKEELIYAK